MKTCVVVGCEQKAAAIIGKPTHWGAWEYRVCPHHHDQAKSGATINDNPDGRTITLSINSHANFRQ